MILQAGRRQGAGMKRVSAAIAGLALATALSTGIVTLPAQAQGTLADSMAARAPNGEERLLLEAAELIYDNDNNQIIASGDVEMYYSGRTLQADRVVYDQTTGRVFAEGNARLIEADGTVATAVRFDLTDDFASGFVDGLRVEQELTDGGRPGTGRFTSPRAERIEGEQTVFERGTYTACDTCEKNPSHPPFWQVRAARVIHDNESRTIYYENAALEFLGVPIAYIPYFWSPDPTVKRKTGFLTPTFVISETLGPGISLPFFIETGPNHDITLRPTFLSRQGVLADVEWRHRLMTGAYSIRATGIFQQDREQFLPPPSGPGDRNFRGSIHTVGRFAINERWDWGWDITAVSDKWYLDDYGVRAASISTKYDREAISSVYLTGRGERSFFDMRGYYFKGLSTTDFQKQQPLVHPVIDYNKRVDGPDALGGEVEIDVNFTSLSREASQFRAAAPRGRAGTFGGFYPTCAPGTFNRDQCLLPGVAGNYSRLTTQVSWKRRYIDDLGQSWTPFAFARADAIWSSPQSTGFQNANTASLMGPSDRFHGRFTPGVGLEYRMPLIARAGNFGTQLLEPMAQVIARPNESRIGRLPNEDAQSLVFDDSNLFNWDRFSGYDRVEGGVRGSYGVRYTLLGDGGFKASAMVGQSVHLAGRNSFRQGDLVNTGLNSGLDSRFSDFVARVDLQPNEYFAISARGRFDRRDFDMNRIEATATARIGPASASVTYARFAAQPDLGYPDRREGLSANGRLQLSRNWYTSGSVMFDLSRHLDDRRRLGPGAPTSSRFSVASMSVGLGYVDECTSFQVTYTAAPRDGSIGSKDENRTIMFQLELRTLGEVGISRTLDDEQGSVFR